MGIGILIFGKSGSGKSTSLRNFKSDDVGIINVISKPLPFKNVNNLKTIDTDNYEDVRKILTKSKAKSIVIDNDIADNFWSLPELVKTLPKDKLVYFIMHEDKNDFGDIKPKTIGRLIDEKVCCEGLFSIVLRSKKVDKNYFFYTQSTDNDVAKSPMGMFNDLYIDNDLKMVDDTIREFYGIKGE